MAYNLKNADEVKEYLKNLHTEYQFGCYHEKKPEVCHLLGDYAETISKDKKEACKLYKMTCDTYNFGRSCTKFGGCSLLENDSAMAYKYSRKGCELDDEKGCLQGGVIAISTDKNIGEKDMHTQIANGVEMLKKSCMEKKNEPACFYLFGLYLHGKEGFVEKNFKEAYKLSLRSCELGNPYACANVAQMHARGDGVERNLDIAETFRKRAETLHKELTQQQKQIKFGLNT